MHPRVIFGWWIVTFLSNLLAITDAAPKDNPPPPPFPANGLFTVKTFQIITGKEWDLSRF